MYLSAFILAIFATVSCGLEEGTRSLNAPYVGDWRSDCSFEGGSFVYRQFSFYSNNRFEYSEESYESDSCEGKADNDLYATGYYYVSSQKKASSVTHEIMFRLDSIDITPGSESVGLNLSELSYCGIPDWTVDESQSVLGASCQTRLDKHTKVYVNDNEDHTKFLNLSGESFFMDEGFLEQNSRDLTGSKFYKFGR